MIIFLTTLMMILSSNDLQFIIHKCLADNNDCAAWWLGKSLSTHAPETFKLWRESWIIWQLHFRQQTPQRHDLLIFFVDSESGIVAWLICSFFVHFIQLLLHLISFNSSVWVICRLVQTLSYKLLLPISNLFRFDFDCCNMLLTWQCMMICALSSSV